jgi:hypothetical protein
MTNKKKKRKMMLSLSTLSLPFTLVGARSNCALVGWDGWFGFEAKKTFYYEHIV